ncbi:regulatory protein RecX [Beggiatoa leptomitoformis]|uniref:Regulatory protein RecX n=1 Tax=Beggiatoa leptomitoformis TaxID=288004 RepID=A0A2N9YEK0_9GAMM|nr:regulatory protein RecX [Beggiatoa leptomitoformis]ALG68852.1 hypothetical protein AL038_15540 [Beggiatoa leptomitoformis]AUI68779.1 hypothetical protein BLE401_08715 [Beggiatoa leptomitoformis]
MLSPDSSTYQQVKNSALDVLSRREHSVVELRHKLLHKGYMNALVEQVVNELQTQQLVSDVRFCESFIRSRINKGYGWSHIQQALKMRGVTQQTINDNSISHDVDWLALAQQVRMKRFGRKQPTTLQERAKQMRFLQYRGFNSEQIRYALTEE